ncbi:hypothetical protein [Defluviimonas sp. SAOS-178_SWC]|uniref:hypothetical protein n=1 Tax=Defluviimonas sp. SAOS-178_SWC TaxID=3121287 RepID=UPI003221559C
MALYWGGTKGGAESIDCGNVTTGDTTDMSLVAWIRLPNNFSGAASVIDRRGNTAAKERFWLLALGDNAGKADFRFVRKYATTNALAITAKDYDTDDATWYFVAGTHLAGNAPKIYVGTQVTDIAEATYTTQTAPAGAQQTGAQPLSLGHHPTSVSTGFGGAIAVVGMFDAELSAADLRAMRLGGLRAILTRSDLTHAWVPALDGVSGSVYDIGPRSIIGATNVNGAMSGSFTQIANPGLLRGFPAVGPADWRQLAVPAAPTVSGGATLNLALSSSAAAEALVEASSTGSLTLASSATGVVEVEAAASVGLVISSSAAAGVAVEGAGSASLVISSSAAAAADVAATVAASLVIGSSVTGAVGDVGLSASAALSLVLASSAAGVAPVAGDTAESLVIGSSALAGADVVAAASAGLVISSSAGAVVVVTGTAAKGLVLGAMATGSIANNATLGNIIIAARQPPQFRVPGGRGSMRVPGGRGSFKAIGGRN